MAIKRKNESSTAAGPRCKKQKTSIITPPPPKPRSRLLTLPAELRNRIYEYALCGQEQILVTTAHREPPLLSANRQTRAEGLGIYYSNTNTFILPIRHCDATLYLRFHSFMDSLGFDNIPSGLVWLSGVPHRPNMLKWCKAVFEGGVSMIRLKNQAKMPASSTYRVVIAGLEIATMGRRSGLSWEVVRTMVGSLMYAVEEYDERWVDQCN